MNKSFVINRKQLNTLFEIVEHFHEIESFEIQVDQSSGIGTGLIVSFDLFQKNDVSIDITDVDSW